MFSTYKKYTNAKTQNYIKNLQTHNYSLLIVSNTGLHSSTLENVCQEGFFQCYSRLFNVSRQAHSFKNCVFINYIYL
jgi:hypothetical protein